MPCEPCRSRSGSMEGSPLNALINAKRYSPQITGFQLGQPNINQRQMVIARYLGDDLGLPDTRGAPQHHRGMRTLAEACDFTAKKFFKMNGAHGICLNVENNLSSQVYLSPLHGPLIPIPSGPSKTIAT